ncbi:MAG TPA: alpha/beta fold hydrolase [Ramlibacter sp.]|nr:alpha/beta fold hydrolase [Ramlibacter sp.]
MQAHSALARLEQAITLGALGLGVAWLAWHWPRSPMLAISGFFFIAFFYSLVLAIEFIAMRFVGDVSLRPTAGELLKAWIGETLMAPRVFCWRQPFRWRAVPDIPNPPDARGKRGVVFIHGFVCNRGFWTPWLERLRDAGQPFIAVNLEPVFGSIDEYVPTIEDAVRRLTEATGQPPMLVCHSMGGLAARAWLCGSAGGHERVHHVITIGSPHHGTWLGRFSHLENGMQMRMGSAWLRELEAHGDPAQDTPFTCWYSNCDNIVFPAKTATLPRADNRLMRGIAHVDLAFHPQVMGESLAMITGTPTGR